MADNIRILNSSMMRDCLNRGDFFTEFPQFAVLKAQESLYRGRGGCRGCRKQIKVNNMFTTFSSMILGLSEIDMTRFKQFMGVTKLYFTGYNPILRKTEIKIL